MPWNAPENDRLACEWTPLQAMEADIFSFGILCLWLLFETYFSGIKPIPQGLDLIAIEIPGLAEDTFCKIKGKLQIYAQQLLAAETAVDNTQRIALKEFFDSSLNADPQKRDGSFQQLLRKLNSEL